MTEEKRTAEKNFEGGSVIPLGVQSETLPSTEFVKVEKNLASLGFFTPSSKRLRNAQEKSFTVTTVVDGKRLEMKGTIIPSAKYGLPITADQDKWIALCNILTDLLQREGKVTNPISFTSADILRILHKHRHSGKNYREVEEWLDVLFSTTIFSEGVIYLANEKRRAKDRFRVLERAVTFGKELPDGKVADKNYVWFSDWQLQNINSNHLLPVDIEAYRQLKNHIAKALVLQLQVWLYATREEGIFEKRYDELCQILNIKQYQYLSLIKQTLAPSLDELQQFGYLADWKIEETSDGQSYKLIFYHGQKFHRDRRARLARKPESEKTNDSTRGTVEKSHRTYQRHDKDEPVLASTILDPQILAELTRRGITEDRARILLANAKPGQDVVAQLEVTDQLIEHAGFKIVNPPGFYIRQIERNMPVPDAFETSAKRKVREEAEAHARERRAAEDARELLEMEYERYCAAVTDRYIEEHPDIFEAIKSAKIQEEARWSRGLSFASTTHALAITAAKWKIREQMTLPTFEEFVEQKKQGTDFSLKLVAPSPAAEAASYSPASPKPAIAEEETLVAPTAELASMEAGPTTLPAALPVTEEPAISESLSEPENHETATAVPEAAIELVSEQEEISATEEPSPQEIPIEPVSNLPSEDIDVPAPDLEAA